VLLTVPSAVLQSQAGMRCAMSTVLPNPAVPLTPGRVCNTITLVKESITKDPEFEDIIQTLQHLPIEKKVPTSLMAYYTLDQDGNLFYDQDRLCIPQGEL